MKRFFLYLILIVGLVYLGSYIYLQITAVEHGDPAPEIEAELIDGSAFKLSDLEGEYVLLDFWGSWCGPCRRANPNLVALHEKYADKVTIVTIALEKVRSSGLAAAEKDGFTWKHQIVEQHSVVMMSSAARNYGVSDIPAKFLIDPNGDLLPKMSFEELDKFLADL